MPRKYFTSVGKGPFHIQMQQEKDMQKNWKGNHLINLEKSKNNYQLAIFVRKHLNVTMIQMECSIYECQNNKSYYKVIQRYLMDCWKT